MDAQQELAFCLANGRGCKKDRKEAAKWYREAVSKQSILFLSPELNHLFSTGEARRKRRWFSLDLQREVSITSCTPLPS